MATSSTPRRGSVVRRVFALTALWAVVVGLTLAGMALGQYWRVSVRALDARIAEDTATLARQIVVTDGVVEVEVPSELRLALADGGSYYGVYDAEGRLLDGDAPHLPPMDVLRTGAWTIDGHRELRVAVSAAGGEGARPHATVRVGRGLASLRTDLWRLATSLLVASLVAVLLAAPLAVWLRREMDRSMRHIDRTARRLAPGLPARIDLATVDAEFVGVAGQLNDAFDRLEQGLGRERQLTADASHELRTPVATILAESEWALARERTPPEYHHALEVCARQGRRLKSLVESLLTLARIESGAESLPYETVSLRGVVDETFLDFNRLARERNVTLHCEGAADARGDRLQLGILVGNLLSNAIRYNRDGGRVDVTLETANDDPPEGHMARLVVRDTGLGLAPEVAARVFDRFWRAAPSRSSREGGTGLGLAISKAIVNAHGGHIDVVSGPGGTAFTVTLSGATRRPASSAPRDSPSPARLSPGSSASGSSRMRS